MTSQIIFVHSANNNSNKNENDQTKDLFDDNEASLYVIISQKSVNLDSCEPGVNATAASFHLSHTVCVPGTQLVSRIVK